MPKQRFCPRSTHKQIANVQQIIPALLQPEIYEMQTFSEHAETKRLLPQRSEHSTTL